MSDAGTESSGFESLEDQNTITSKQVLQMLDDDRSSTSPRLSGREADYEIVEYPRRAFIPEVYHRLFNSGETFEPVDNEKGAVNFVCGLYPPSEGMTEEEYIEKTRENFRHLIDDLRKIPSTRKGRKWRSRAIQTDDTAWFASRMPMAFSGLSTASAPAINLGLNQIQDEWVYEFADNLFPDQPELYSDIAQASAEVATKVTGGDEISLVAWGSLPVGLFLLNYAPKGYSNIRKDHEDLVENWEDQLYHFERGLELLKGERKTSLSGREYPDPLYIMPTSINDTRRNPLGTQETRRYVEDGVWRVEDEVERTVLGRALDYLN